MPLLLVVVRTGLALLLFGTLLAAWCAPLIGGILLISAGLTESHPWQWALGTLLLSCLAFWSAKAMKGTDADNVGV
jgi:hypothetical protein